MNAVIFSLETLKSARREKAAELAGVLEARERLRTAESEEAAILAAIGTLGAAEVQAMREWAMSGGDGEPPMCDAAERTRLNGRLVQAQTQAAAAKGAATDLDADQARLTAEMQGLSEQIEFVSLEHLIAEHDRSRRDLIEFAWSVRRRVAETYACHAMLIQRANNVMISNPGLASEYLRAAQKIAGAEQPTLEPGMDDVMAQVPKWLALFDQFCSDRKHEGATA